MVTKQKHFLDSLRHMVSKTGETTCISCQKTYEGDFCPDCNSNKSETLENSSQTTTMAYLVDLVSNHKIKIPTPSCKVGRDEANDIVVSGDQSISRHHLSIISEDSQFYIEDQNSRHGTFLNGSQIKKRESINDGDVVKIGVSLFWFVIEDTVNTNEDTNEKASAPEKPPEFEQAHVTVKPETQSQPSDPSTSTMNEIPVMSNEQSLLDRLRNKTRSFDHSGVYASVQTQPGTIAPQPEIDRTKSLSETQKVLPSLKNELENIATESTISMPEPETPAEVESFAVPQIDDPTQIITAKHNSIPAATMPTQAESVNTALGSTEPRCQSQTYEQLLESDLLELNNKHDTLKTKIDEAQIEMEKIASQLSSLKELGSALISGSGNPLIEACYKVFSELGWQITTNPQDPQELQLRLNGQLAIGRVIWTTKELERADLGQLSIAQTNLWCEGGNEPKGILIVSRLADENNQTDLTPLDYQSELTAYAAKKNVCMLTSLQVLAIYRDMIIKQSDTDSLRETIISSNGWLPGFALKNAN